MKKNNFLLLFLLILKLFLPLRPYRELNDTLIIDEIIVQCDDEYYITYREIIPKKEDGGIHYDYKRFQEKNSSLKDGIQKLEDGKYFYKERAKIDLENCDDEEEMVRQIKRG